MVCRARKTKCDNQRPICGFCRTTNGACGYPDDTAADFSKLDRGSLAILQRISEMEQTLTAVIGERMSLAGSVGSAVNTGNTGPFSTPTSIPGSAPSQRNFSHDNYIDFDNPPISIAVAAMHHQLPNTGDSPPTADVITKSSEMRVENILQWPVFRTQGYPSLAVILGQESSYRPFSSSDGMLDLDTDTINQLVENFLANNHIKNPIFVVDQLWARVRDISETGLRWDGSTCLVLLMCAISVLSSPVVAEGQPGYSRRADRLQRAEHFFQMAQRRIGVLYHTNSLLAVQCGFLTAVYLMSTFRIMAAWKAFAQAGTQCVGWMAAREHKTAPTPPDAMDMDTGVDGEQHMEESLYWSCLKSELELRTELELPGSTLNEMQYSHEYPSPPNPAQLVAGHGQGQTQVQREQLERGWFFYLAEIALRRIMNDALSSRYASGSWYYTVPWWTATGEDWLRSDIEGFRQKLDTWQAMLPTAMRFDVTSDEPTHDALRGILRGHYVDILDVLCFPAVRAVVCSRRYDDLGLYVVDAAREGLLNAVYRIKICREGFYHRHQGTWLMLRTCSRSVLQLLAVALRARDESAVAPLLPDGWRDATTQVLALLEYWQHESADLALLQARIREILADLDATGLP